MTDARLAELMVKVVDEVATLAEREELMTHIQGDETLRRELETHMAMKAITDGWVERLAYDLALDHHEAARGEGWMRSIGLSALLLGFGVLAIWGGVEIFVDPEAPIWVKAGLGLMGGGAGLLLFSVIRWRWKTAPSDKYREVNR
jgi:hypothetical protein